MKHRVGDLLDPKRETDISFDNFPKAYETLARLSQEKENYVVGLWEEDNDYAEYVAINGEVFRSV